MKQMNSYIDSVFSNEDDLLEEVVSSIKENGMPSISVSPSAGKLLTMLVSISGGIFLARGFGKEGTLTSLELKKEYAELAHSNLTKAGFGGQVTYMTGAALQSLEQLVKSDKRFDFFFIDADKGNYEQYLTHCIELAKPGAVIVADNVLAGGSVADQKAAPRRHTEVMRTFNKTVAQHPQLESLLIPIGDGMTV
ncbi:O-methyltransferase [Bacillus spizizenii]|uniref:O-methyltransferase n=1 Tax=Bacillus spizizenii TaxID=96241 RepID=UPI00086F718D|nr:O-methyltransferase [Bacillus spizizenii]MED0870091.1 O-methyltransferase [Bacillus spizizenii]MED1071756.1 O-methyltransferase [Bacillus spizizenii]SCV39592.1 O-methyltransferase [Bacillus subtilis]